MEVTERLSVSILATYGLWFLLAIPAYPLVLDLWQNDRYYPELMHLSGMWSVQLLIATLLVTPVCFLLRLNPYGLPFARWLMKRRRNLGVASFIFAFLHVWFYVREIGEPRLILLEAIDLEFLTGWIGFVIFLLLAVTANDWSTKRLLGVWKPLHRLVYLAGALIFIHWLLLEFFNSIPVGWFAPLIAARIAHILLQRALQARRRQSLAG